MPKPPVYVCHPRDSDPSVARHFGASPGKTYAFDPDSDDPRQQEFARHIVRYAERRPVWDAGFARLVYIGEGGAPPGQYRMDMICLPKGVGYAAMRAGGGRLFRVGRLRHGGLGGGRAYCLAAPQAEGLGLQSGRPGPLFPQRRCRRRGVHAACRHGTGGGCRSSG